MRKRALIALVALVCLVATGCGAGGSEAGTLVVQSGNPAANLSNIDLYVAQKEGFFDDEGLDVSVRYSNGATLAAQLVASGKADVASITFEPIVDAYSKGVKGSFFWAKYKQGIYSVQVPENSPIRSFADLKGKTVGVASLTSSAIPFTKINLRRAGVPTDSVTFQPTGLGGPAKTAVQSGDVQALALWSDPYSTLAQDGLRLRTVEQGGVGRPGGGGYFASDKVLDGDKRSDLEKYAKALAKADAFIAKNPQKAIEDYWAVNPSAKSVGMQSTLTSLKAVLGDFVTSPPYGVFDPDEVESYVKQYADVQGVDDPPSVDQLITNDVAEQADRSVR
ncbi:ABC transporter substrate-binding protein [Marmoricola endophyticus]|uniref:Thiamine pyrimidine synthase n=1 Tax=Marmoricola endophyticus TaxID=2040280 RepID=A0A917F7E9_9ACTN|nr:ABC transporter substrate-binding protein [Marmoricola endophyticus]GGF51146.1 ABC transporter substrate-binding protein [Marmoricola endophyticus]